MKRLLFTAALALAALPLRADSLKATVGHMCCGNCKASATAGLKNVTWIDSVSIDGDVVTMNCKAGSKIDVVSACDALAKCGFPATNIEATAPVTFTIAHLCCGNCANSLKEKVANFRGTTLDKERAKVDLGSKTLVIGPAAGQKMNVAAVLRQLQTNGFAASACSLGSASASAGSKTVATR